MKSNLKSVLGRVKTLGRNILSYGEQSCDILEDVYEISS